MSTVLGIGVWLETAPWVMLGPLNILKVAYVNKPSPLAQYWVVSPAETCQAACNIARMWACLFWGLQTVVAIAILRRAMSPQVAALAKAFVGTALLAAFVENTVRAPVAIVGMCELISATCLLSGATVTSPLTAGSDLFHSARRLVAQFGTVWFVVHWLCFALTLFAFWLAIGSGVDVASLARRLPIVGAPLAEKLANLDTTSGVARFSVAWACAFATAPIRAVSDVGLTLFVGCLVRSASRKRDKSKAD